MSSRQQRQTINTWFLSHNPSPTSRTARADRSAWLPVMMASVRRNTLAADVEEKEESEKKGIKKSWMQSMYRNENWREPFANEAPGFQWGHSRTFAKIKGSDVRCWTIDRAVKRATKRREGDGLNEHCWQSCPEQKPPKNTHSHTSRNQRKGKRQEGGDERGEKRKKKTLGNVKTRVIPVGLTRRPPST